LIAEELEQTRLRQAATDDVHRDPVTTHFPGQGLLRDAHGVLLFL
jgi:hypothetical protein